MSKTVLLYIWHGRLTIQMKNGQTMYENRTFSTFSFCKNEPWKPKSNLCINQSQMVNDCQLSYFPSVLPTQHQPQKAKYGIQDNHTRGPISS